MPDFARVDSHAHVFDPVAFPLRDTGGHMPGPAECGTAQQFLTVLDAHQVSHGLPTTDAQAAKQGALLPFGGHKGYALGLAMQALGVLAGSGLNEAKDYGYLIIAMRPDLLLPLADFKRDLSELLARIKAAPRQEGVTEIRLPSEKSFSSRERALREGIRIDRMVHTRLLALAAHQTVQP